MLTHISFISAKTIIKKKKRPLKPTIYVENYTVKVLHWEKNYARKNTYSRDTLLRDARINHKAGRREGGKERKAPAETENGVQVGVQEKRRKGKENWGFHGLKLCDSSKNDLKVLCLFFPLTLLLWLLRLVAFFATWITLRTLPTVVSQKKKKEVAGI